MEKAPASENKPPKRVITDGLEGYKEAVRAAFPRGTEHEVAAGIQGESIQPVGKTPENDKGQDKGPAGVPGSENWSGLPGSENWSGLPGGLGY